MKLITKKFRRPFLRTFFLNMRIRKVRIPESEWYLYECPCEADRMLGLAAPQEARRINPDINLFPSGGEPKRILIVKPDSAGDYLLFRNGIRTLRESTQYKNAEVTLIVSSAIRGIPEYIDGEDVKKIFYVPHPFWEKSDQEQIAVLKQFFDDGLPKQFDAVFFPSFSRGAFEGFNQLLCANISAQEKITNTGDFDFDNLANMRTNCSYTRVVSNTRGRNRFEYENNVEFIEAVCDAKMPRPVHRIDLPKTPQTEKYIVINPSAQEDFRMWHPYNYAKLIADLMRVYGLRIWLIGGKADKERIEAINRLVGGGCSVLCGRPWRESIDLINNAALYIGNDSGCFHLAVSLGTKSICIAGGAGYQRFTHYPDGEYYRVLLDPDTRAYLHSWMSRPENQSRTCTFFGNPNTVAVDTVFKNVRNMLGEP